MMILGYIFLVFWTFLTGFLGLYTFKKGFDYLELLEKQPDKQHWYTLRVTIAGGLLFFICLIALLIAMSHMVILSHYVNFGGGYSWTS